MATLVEKGSDSGVNLSELTEMERFLIGMLGHKIRLYTVDNDYTNHRTEIPCEFNSIVTSISFSIRFPSWDVNDVDPSPNNITMFGPYKSYSLKDGTTHIETIKPTRKNIEVGWSHGCEFTITSFTTKDGKVHTSDNLNY